MSEPSRGRIAIKFGAGPAAPSSSRSSRPNPPSSTLGKRPRPSHHRHALGGASDSESEDDGDDDKHRERHERITGFGVEGAETEGGRRQAKAPKEYIIQRQANCSWKDAIRAKGKGQARDPSHPKAGSDREGDPREKDPVDEQKSLKWGLTIKERKPEAEEQATKTFESSKSSSSSSSKNRAEAPREEEKPRTADEEAMDALLGRMPQKKDLVIAQPSEDDAYRRDVEAAGAPSTLEDYEAMPVEEFGAALLRGMGWSGENLGPEVKQVRRRPNRLGLGAKELKEDEDLGGWDQNGKKKQQRRPRLDEYRREESKRKEGRRHEESYKRERERERERERDRNRDRDRDYERHRDRHRDYDRDRRR
ncbi:Pre-mRNA-splicing factor SPP2 [Escovopsis weberi]|uniref:Pre-mRNA-splicing factor n=1 Tax=Escovopsis weberi TaxID=150374 RepID=A0A0N0RTC9_ESCWE|nr:Pre-mRNA-splicing factor SPP2 [Escovopsis weberi]